MSAGAIAVIVVVVIIIVVVIATIAGMAARRRRLQQKFGPEYDRLVAESDSRRQAEAELAERERRVQKLELRDLPEEARRRYADQWVAVQERFVDAPAEAIAEAQQLLEQVMLQRGYPVEQYDQVVADLSVDHARTIEHFRTAHEISARADQGRATTEDLRVAMLHYRELFAELLGGPATGFIEVPADSGEPAGASGRAGAGAAADVPDQPL